VKLRVCVCVSPDLQLSPVKALVSNIGSVSCGVDFTVWLTKEGEVRARGGHSDSVCLVGGIQQGGGRGDFTIWLTKEGEVRMAGRGGGSRVTGGWVLVVGGGGGQAEQQIDAGGAPPSDGVCVWGGGQQLG